MIDAVNSIDQSAQGLTSIASAMRQYGVDTNAILNIAASLELIGATSQMWQGVTMAVTAMRSKAAARYAAELVKYGPNALAVAGVSLAVGYAAGSLIESMVNNDLSSSEGQRSVSMRV